MARSKEARSSPNLVGIRDVAILTLDSADLSNFANALRDACA